MGYRGHYLFDSEIYGHLGFPGPTHLFTYPGLF